MTTSILSGWWQQYRENNLCTKLHRELLILVHGDPKTAERLINLEKMQHPGRLESWYLDKIIYDLRRAA